MRPRYIGRETLDVFPGPKTGNGVFCALTGNPQTSPVRISTTTFPHVVVPSGLRRETVPRSM